jgi:iron-sulfur cluster insertion protein
MITLTESAITRISKILSDEGPDAKLRMYIEGGGCSGFNYGFAIDSTKNDDDFEIPAGSLSVLIDAVSAQYLEGAIVDYKKTLLSENFVIKNPKAKGTCGCGSSFNPY